MAKDLAQKTTGRRTRAASAVTPSNTPAVTPAVTPAAITFTDRNNMTFTYDETDAAPQTRSGREKLPNPHGAGIARAVEMKASAPTKQLSTPALPNAEIGRHMRWLREGGKEAGVTIRIVVEAVEGTETSRIHFRAVNLVTKPNRRKAKAATTTTDTPADTQAEVPADTTADTPAELIAA